MTKDIYIQVYEELVQQFIDAGHDERKAELMAEDRAYDAYRDRIGDMVDYARMKAKEGKL